MGISLSKLVKGKEITLKDLKGKTIVVDSMNMIYQFITTLRMADGTPLSDGKGNITAHLVGILSRVVGLMEKDIKQIFVFDGKPPELKKEERERRRLVKQEAERKYEIAKERGDLEAMRKYASMTARIDKKIIDESKQLLSYLGFPIVQAPSEGEAQCAYIAKKGNADYVVSQDFDVFLFGAPKVVRNLALQTRRYTKTPSIKEVLLEDLLKNLNINQDQLIALGILIGTDFNRGGIKGIGPVKGLKLVKEFGNNLDQLFEYVEWKKFYDFSWKTVFEIFKSIEVTDNYDLSFKQIDENALFDFLVNKKGFSKERVENAISRILKVNYVKEQKKLADFF